MSFRKVKGKTKNVYLPVTVSTALAARSIVTLTSGKLVAAVAGTLAPNLAGVLVGAITADDADYATERLVAVEVPVEKNVVYEYPVVAGVAADIGVDVDLLNASTVDRSASAIGVVRATKVLSTTLEQGYVKVNGAY